MGNKKNKHNAHLREMREKRQQEEMKKKLQEQRLMKIIGISALAFVLVVVGVTLLLTKLLSKPTAEEEETPATVQYALAPTDSYTVSQTATNYVKLNVSYTADDGTKHNGDIIVKLDPENAPITVANFQKLVGEGFYDGLIFHRVIENFMIQGGDPQGTGLGGSAENITGEFPKNGVDNTILHERGVISMARQGASTDAQDAYYYNTASSQFFIVHQTSTHLDGKYAAFGHVVFGMTSVDGIATVATNSNDKPLRQAKIESAVFVNYTEQGE